MKNWLKTQQFFQNSRPNLSKNSRFRKVHYLLLPKKRRKKTLFYVFIEQAYFLSTTLEPVYTPRFRCIEFLRKFWSFFWNNWVFLFPYLVKTSGALSFWVNLVEFLGKIGWVLKKTEFFCSEFFSKCSKNKPDLESRDAAQSLI